MSHLRVFQISFSVLWVLATWGFDRPTRNAETKSAVAAPLDECRVVGQIDRLEGEGMLLREGTSNPLTPGKPLCAGDRLQLTANTRATAICAADGTARSLPVGTPSLATSICPAVVEECEDPATSGNVGCGRNPIAILPSNLPHILSPRNTALLTTQPHISWSAVPGASRYTVTLETVEAIWGPIEVTGTEVTYTGEVPLAAGTSYKLTVVADNGAMATSRFALLDDAEQTEVMQLLEMQPVLEMQPAGEGVTIPPRVYVYTDNLLFAEAIDTLETEIANGNRSSAIYLQLGQLYQDIDLSFKVEEAYHDAIERAKGERNLKAEALAHIRLGQLYQNSGNLEAAIEQFFQAKELYDRSGNGDRSQDVDELLQEIITPFDR